MKHSTLSRTPDSKREDWFAGWEEFSRLSRGIMEEPEKEEEDEEVELLAVPPPSYDPTADDELLEKKKKKPDCLPGNPEHRASDGKFAKKGTGASWSKGPHRGHRKDCKHGSRRSKGRFTKVACGRKKGPDGKPDPKGNKADYRCYDAKKVREQRARQALGKLTHEEGAALVLEVVTRVLGTQSLTEGKQEQLATACKQAGFYSLDFFTQLQNQLALSADGKLSGD